MCHLQRSQYKVRDSYTSNHHLNWNNQQYGLLHLCDNYPETLHIRQYLCEKPNMSTIYVVLKSYHTIKEINELLIKERFPWGKQNYKPSHSPSLFSLYPWLQMQTYEPGTLWQCSAGSIQLWYDEPMSHSSISKQQRPASFKIITLQLGMCHTDLPNITLHANVLFTPTWMLIFSLIFTIAQCEWLNRKQ